MLTGRRAFEGEDVSLTLAEVMKSEPDYARLPTDTPASIRRLLRRCLQKQSARRLADAHDVGLELTDDENELAVATRSGPADSRRFRPAIWAAVGLLLGIVGTLVVRDPSETPAAGPDATLRLALAAPELARYDALASWRTLAISPDGNHVVYVASEEDGTQLYRQSLSEFRRQAIPGTGGGSNPSFSPGGRSLAFTLGDRLMKTSLEIGQPLEICRCGHLGRAWEDDDTIWLGSGPSGLRRVSSAGGVPEAFPALEGGRLQIVADGAAILHQRNSTSAIGQSVWIQSRQGDAAVEVAVGTSPRFLPTGHLLFARAEALWAARFDPLNPSAAEGAIPVVRDLWHIGGIGQQYAVSDAGTLVYVPSSDEIPAAAELVVVGRNGQSRLLAPGDRELRYPRYSPSGRQVAVGEGLINGQVWIVDDAGRMTGLTSSSNNVAPVWTDDGRAVVFSSDRDGVWELYKKASDGSGVSEGVLQRNAIQLPTGWTADGAVLFVELVSITEENRDILVLWPDSSVQELVVTPANERAAALSPAGDWFVYVSDLSGQDEIYVERYPTGGGRRVVSTGGGREPIWSKDGREIFYRAGRSVMVADVTYEPTFDVSPPRALFETDAALDPAPTVGVPNYDVSPDGQEFVMVRTTAGRTSEQVHVIVNWFEELNRLVPID